MARASILLRDERATLAAVAAQIGYGSEAAFSAAFKRYSGIAPGRIAVALVSPSIERICAGSANLRRQ